MSHWNSNVKTLRNTQESVSWKYCVIRMKEMSSQWTSVGDESLKVDLPEGGRQHHFTSEINNILYM